MKKEIQTAIYTALAKMKEENLAAIETLTDTVSLSDYAHLTRQSEHGTIWTEALQTALRNHQRIIIPPAEDLYWIDDTVTIPSDRHIEAAGEIGRAHV